MKSLTAVISIAALTLPISAVAQDMPNTTTKVLAQPATAQNQDSPLVRAAKATGRLGKKPTNVITNETLVRTGGHFTTTTINNPLPPASASQATSAAPTETAMRAKAEADAYAKREAAKKQRQLSNAAADYYGESVEERVNDPAMQEHVMNQITSTQPQTAPTKPPER